MTTNVKNTSEYPSTRLRKRPNGRENEVGHNRLGMNIIVLIAREQTRRTMTSNEMPLQDDRNNAVLSDDRTEAE